MITPAISGYSKSGASWIVALLITIVQSSRLTCQDAYGRMKNLVEKIWSN
jgi:hypothetical protein